MEVLSNRSFIEESVLLDGKHFIDCSFKNCNLTYGGGIVILERTSFSGCDYTFGGQAGRTVDLLKVVGLLGQPPSYDRHPDEPIN